MSELIECATCSGKLAALAQYCPHCGAPNAYVHPRIKAFLMQKDSIATTKRFSFKHDKTTLRGETASKITLSGWAFAVAALACIAVIGVFYFNFWVFVVLGVAVVIVMELKFNRKQWFVADCAAGKWVSSDEAFWQPVRKVLEL